MTSKTFSSKKGLFFCYREALKGQRGLMGILFLLLMLGYPLLSFLYVNSEWENSQSGAAIMREFSSYQNLCGRAGLAPLCMLFSVLVSVSLFRYIHGRRSSDLYHSLPVTRCDLLYGRYLAGLTAVLAPLFISAACELLMAAGFGALGAEYLFLVFGQMFYLALMTAAALALCMFLAVCSANTSGMVLSVLGIGGAYPLLMLAVIEFTTMFLPGFSSNLLGNGVFMAAFSPFVSAFYPLEALSNAMHGGEYQPDWGFLVWWIFLTALLLVGTGLLYRRRRETDGKRAPVILPELIIRFFLTLTGGIGGACILKLISPAGFWIGLTGGFVAAFAITQLTYSHGLRDMKDALKLFGVYALVFLVGFSVLASGCFGYVSRIPSADAVESVSYSFITDADNEIQILLRNGSRGYTTIKSIEPALTEPETIASVMEFHRQALEFYKQQGIFYGVKERSNKQYHISYQLKDGTVLTRDYGVMRVENPKNTFSYPLMEQEEAILKSREYIRKTNAVFYAEPQDISSLEQGSDVEIPLDQQQKSRFLEALQQDLLDGALTTGYSGRSDSDDRYTVFFRDVITPQPGSDLEKLLQQEGIEGEISLLPLRFELMNKECRTAAFLQEIQKDAAA